MDKIHITTEIKEYMVEWFAELPKERQDYFFDALDKQNVTLELPFENITLEDISKNPKWSDAEIKERIARDIKRYNFDDISVGNKVAKMLTKMYKLPALKDSIVYREGICAIYSMVATGDFERVHEGDFQWSKERYNLNSLRLRILGLESVNKNLSLAVRQQTMLLRLYLTLFYMTETRSVDMTERKVQKKRVGKAKKGKKPQTRVVNVTEVIYKPITLGNSKEDAVVKSTFTRHIESWGVRGHWRTYKDGRKIWIKPQVRGLKCAPVQDKIYQIAQKTKNPDVSK